MNKISLSVFFKLFLVILGTGLAVFGLVAGFMNLQYRQQIRDTFDKNIENYFHYLATEIGSPPDTVKAKALAANYSLQIAYSSDAFAWSTTKFEPQKWINRWHRMRKPGPQWWRHQICTVTNEDGSQLKFGFDPGKFMENHEVKVALLFILIGLVFILSYLLIQKILRPIKWLNQGVLAVSSGNLNHQIPVKSRDELGKLSHSFNAMTTRIQEMIRARDQLLLDVSHELRSPLTRMKLALEFLSDDKFKQRIHDDLGEMETMITEILETERLKNGHGKLKLKSHNLIEIIHSVAASFEARPPGISLSPLPETCYLMLDPERIKIVLKNLLENAFKYARPASQPVEITLEITEKTVRLNIKDDGIGIPEDHLPYLFEPFYRVDKSRSKKTGGYGLGLGLCKKIMEAHGGQIELSNEKTGGVKVVLTFSK